MSMFRVAYIVGILSFFVSACDFNNGLDQSDVLTRGPNTPITDVRNPTNGTKSLSVYTETDADECQDESCEGPGGAASDAVQTLYDLGSNNSINCAYDLSEPLKQLIVAKNYKIKTWIAASQAVTASGQKSPFEMDRVHSIGAPASIRLEETASAIDNELFKIFDQNDVEVGFILASDFGDPGPNSEIDGSGMTGGPSPEPTHEVSFLRLFFQCAGSLVDENGITVSDIELDYSSGAAKFFQINDYTLDAMNGSGSGTSHIGRLNP